MTIRQMLLYQPNKQQLCNIIQMLDNIFQSMFNPNVAKQWSRVNQQYAIDYQTSFQMGGYGKVFRGFSFYINCMVAIKVVTKEQVNPKQIQVLESNIKLRKSYVMRYYGYFEKQGKVYIFLEICNNGTLRSRMKDKISELEVLRLFRQLVQGMRYLHIKKKIHKDLIPQNILLGPMQDIKICDFGLEKDETSSIFRTGNLGTAVYAAPEVYFSQLEEENKHSQKSDVWNAGVILYEMLTGYHIFEKANNFDDLKDEWLAFQRGTSSIRISPSFHPIWSYLINWMLTFRAHSRPSFEEIHQHILKLYSQIKEEIQKDVKVLTPQLKQTTDRLYSDLNKYQILLDLCETFTREDIRLKNEFKYMMMFCCIMRYLSFCRGYLPKIERHKIISEKQISLSESSPLEGVLFTREKAVLEQKYHFYHHQVRSIITPKILHDYCERKDSQYLIQDLNGIIKLVRAFDQGQEIAHEEVYDDAFKSILKVIERRQGDVTQCFNHRQLEIYCQILLTMLMTQRYLHNKTEETSFKHDFEKMKSMDREKLVEHIKLLADHVF